MALRKLKYHEAKLLKKVDFLDWKEEGNLREAAIVGKYGLKDRDEYTKYAKVVGKIRKVRLRQQSDRRFLFSRWSS
jgi:U3 small nucleolar ribonucleoprotein protein IMP3